MRYNTFKTRTKALAKQTGVKLSSLRETAANALGFHDLHDLQKRLD